MRVTAYHISIVSTITSVTYESVMAVEDREPHHASVELHALQEGGFSRVRVRSAPGVNGMTGVNGMKAVITGTRILFLESLTLASAQVEPRAHTDQACRQRFIADRAMIPREPTEARLYRQPAHGYIYLHTKRHGDREAWRARLTPQNESDA